MTEGSHASCGGMLAFFPCGLARTVSRGLQQQNLDCETSNWIRLLSITSVCVLGALKGNKSCTGSVHIFHHLASYQVCTACISSKFCYVFRSDISTSSVIPKREMAGNVEIQMAFSY